jgi:hypothetical protein
MRKRIHKEELMFDVSDTKKIKLGKDLHIPMIDPTDGLDWNVESFLMAMEIAQDNGMEPINIPDTVMTFSFTFYCKINGQTYHITESREKEYGSFKTKIELV